MSVQHVPGSPDQFQLVIDFDLQATDDGNWMLYTRTDAARDWVCLNFKMMADPILDARGTSIAIEMLRAENDLVFTIDGDLVHGA